MRPDLPWFSKKAVAMSAVAVLSAGVLSACTNTSSSTASGSPTSSSKSNGPIIIGASLSLTGDFSADGQAFKRGYQLWAKDVNARGGILGRQVELTIVNDDSSPNQVVTNYQNLFGQDHVDLAFGPFSWSSAAGTAGNGGGPPEAGPLAAAPQAGGGRPTGFDVWAEGRQAAQIIADPVRGDRTVAGMPVRVPRANLLPGSAGGGRHADSRVNGRTADSHEAQTPAALQRRSPETARSRLSGFQSGTRRAEGQTSRTEEGADR